MQPPEEEHPESEEDFSSDPDDAEGGDDPGSDSSTRSRSHGRQPDTRDKSTDHSYQGFPPSPCADLNGPVASNSPADNTLSGLLLIACVADSWLPKHEIKDTCRLAWLSPCLGFARLGFCSAPDVVKQLRVPDFAGYRINLTGTVADQPLRLPRLRDIGDRSPGRPEDFDPTVQLPEGGPPAPMATMRVLAVLLIPCYRPEPVLLTLPVPGDIAQAMRELQTFRSPDIRHLFPSLVPVPYQPMVECVLFLATTRWPKLFVEVLLDCRQINGLIFAVSVPPLATAALLSEHAGVAWWRSAAVWVEPFLRPLQASDVVCLQPGSLVVFQAPDGASPGPGDLSAMLRTTVGWDRDVTLPFHFDPSVFIVSDEGSFRYAMGGVRLQRSALAGLLEYDPEATVAVPPEPPIRNYCDHGAATSAVLVVSKRLPLTRGFRRGPCAVIPIFQGVTWRIVWDGMFPLSQYVAEHIDRCPAGFQVDVQGAFPIAGGDFLSVCDGTTLVVCYTFMQPARPGDSSAESDSGSSVHTFMSETGDEGSSDTSDGPQDRAPAGPQGGFSRPPHCRVLDPGDSSFFSLATLRTPD